jgi:hypothetical protein
MQHTRCVDVAPCGNSNSPVTHGSVFVRYTHRDSIGTGDGADVVTDGPGDVGLGVVDVTPVPLVLQRQNAQRDR